MTPTENTTPPHLRKPQRTWEEDLEIFRDALHEVAAAREKLRNHEEFGDFQRRVLEEQEQRTKRPNLTATVAAYVDLLSGEDLPF